MLSESYFSPTEVSATDLPGNVLYAICFIGNFGVPRTLNGRERPQGVSFAIDAGLLGALRVATQCHGPQVVQGLVDPNRAEAGRTFDYVLSQARAHSVVHTVAANGRRDLVCRKPAVRLVLRGLFAFAGDWFGFYISDPTTSTCSACVRSAVSAGPIL